MDCIPFFMPIHLDIAANCNRMNDRYAVWLISLLIKPYIGAVSNVPDRKLSLSISGINACGRLGFCIA